MTVSKWAIAATTAAEEAGKLCTGRSTRAADMANVLAQVGVTYALLDIAAAIRETRRFDTE